MVKLGIFVAITLLACHMIFNVEAAPEEASKCLRTCPVTADLFIICGDDGNTYTNRASLNCYNKCSNKNVQIRHDGEC